MKRAFLSLLLGLCLNSVIGQSGNIDTSFHIGTGFSATVTAIAKQPDNKIIVGGLFTSYNGTSYKSLVRLKPNGTIDSTFHVGTNGINGTIKSIYVLPDTSIIVAGGISMVNTTSVYGIVKLDKNGNIDPSFNISNSLDGGINAMDVDVLTGKIYIGGNFTTVNGTPSKHIARLLPNGDLDNSFVVGSGFTGMFGSAPVYSLLVQADQKLLVGGDFMYYQGLIASKLCRIKQNGDVDTAFVTNLSSGFDNIIRAIEQMADGKILVGGDFTVCQGSTYNKIACLNSDGSPNTSFDVAGGPSGSVYSLKKTPNNKIMVGGSFNFFNGVMDRALVRINANGTRDANFATGTGFTQTGNAPIVYATYVSTDSSVFAGGYFDKYQDSSYLNIVKIVGKGNSTLTIPTLTTNIPTLITNNSAKFWGEVIDNGNSAILENGVCWSTSANPSISDNFASTSIGSNAFNLFVYNLQDTTRYYVRAYARNSEGYGYGDEITFKTRSNENYTCGEVTFTYNGIPVTYGTVKGKYGRCWLDRDLGSSRVAESANDALAKGDYFQWGRLADGHQLYGSDTTSELSTTSNPGHSKFIVSPNAPNNWMTTDDNSLWEGLNAPNNPCPSGWRIPTQSEFLEEMSIWEDNTINGAFNSSLRLHYTGARSYNLGGGYPINTLAVYWTSSASNDNAKLLSIEPSVTAVIANGKKAFGASVRCIKDYTVGIEESKLQNSTLSIYPNPANSSITINYSGDLSETTSFAISNYLGQELLRGTLLSNTTTINVGNLSNGIYFVKIRTNKNQEIQRLVIQK